MKAQKTIAVIFILGLSLNMALSQEKKTATAAPPTVPKGAAEIKWALGGRYIHQETKGEMMGRPMSGIGFTGYDNINKKFISSSSRFTIWQSASQTRE